MNNVQKIKDLLNGQKKATDKLSTAVKVINSITAASHPDLYYPNENDHRVSRRVSTDLYHFTEEELEKASNTLYSPALKTVLKEVESILSYTIRTFVIPAHRDPDDARQKMIGALILEVLPSWNPEMGGLRTFTKSVLSKRVHRHNHEGDAIHIPDNFYVLRGKLVRYISDKDIDIEQVYDYMDEICAALHTTPEKVGYVLDIERYEYHSSIDTEDFKEDEIVRDVGNNRSAETYDTDPEGTNTLIFTELKNFALKKFKNDEDITKIGVKAATMIVALHLGAVGGHHSDIEITQEVKANTNIKQPKKAVDTVLHRWHDVYERAFAEKCLKEHIIGA